MLLIVLAPQSAFCTMSSFVFVFLTLYRVHVCNHFCRLWRDRQLYRFWPQSATVVWGELGGLSGKEKIYYICLTSVAVVKPDTMSIILAIAFHSVVAEVALSHFLVGVDHNLSRRDNNQQVEETKGDLITYKCTVWMYTHNSFDLLFKLKSLRHHECTEISKDLWDKYEKNLLFDKNHFQCPTTVQSGQNSVECH